MSGLPPNYIQKIISIIEHLMPSAVVKVISDDAITVNGRTLHLSNLYRMASIQGKSSDEYLEKYLNSVLTFGGASFGTFEDAKTKILPRIHPRKMVENMIDPPVYMAFANDTVICYVVDMVEVMVSLSLSQMAEWGMSIESLDHLARQNLADITPDFQIDVLRTREGGYVSASRIGDGYDSSRLLLPTLYDYLSPFLKGDFYAAAPARDALVFFSMQPKEMVDRFRAKTGEDFKKFPYPITSKLFIVNSDGIFGE